MSKEQSFEHLRNAIETAIGRKMKSPRDFDFLAQAVFDKLHQSISVSTLKRFWGYIPHNSTTRSSTLDLLAQFIDYEDYDHFCTSIAGEVWDADTPDVPSGTATAPLSEAGKRMCTVEESSHTLLHRLLPFAAIMLLLAVVGGILLWSGGFWGSGDDSSADGQKYILRRGQIFETSADYLRIFGITGQQRYWDQPLPHHDGVIIWGPEYHHPQWHNEGDRDSLMPTITEWWTPADSADDTPGTGPSATSETERQLLAAERNEHLYFTVMRTNELRITFMKNLTDTGYVFLGIYRTDLTQSDSTHLVWERVADECDLRSLDYLQQLRH